VDTVTSGKNPTVISTFAGTGGSSLGYHWAGYKELLAIDWEAYAVKSFQLNFPDVPIWHKDITQVSSQEILEFCNLKVGEIDVFDGSPPCQGFSTAGKRQVIDPRNNLFYHYWRLVTELQPKVFVMENVSGMIKGRMRGKFLELFQIIKSGNYNVKCKLMNAMYYGVPQSRERLIFIGVRKDLNKIPVFPTPSNKIVSFKEATKDIKDLGEIPKVFPLAQRYLGRVSQGESISKYHPKGHWFSSYRASNSKPIRTLLKQSGNQTYHPLEDRCLSINELKLLCSFPEDWKLVGNYSEQVARLGNAVMPKFMQSIAQTIKEKIL